MAMLAGTGASMAAGMRRTMIKLACLFALALVVGLLVAGAIGTFGFAVYAALLPQLGIAWSAAVSGLSLLVIAGVLVLICRAVDHRRKRPVSSGAADLGGSLGAAALGASMGGLPDLDIRGALSRNAVTVLLAAFIAGMVMNNRR
jgi:hypothetical protein